MIKPKAIVFSGYGLNCEEETKYAFELAGSQADIVHINDLIAGYYNIDNYQILAIPGGFAYGDDTGSGNAYALKMKNHLWEKILNFIKKDVLIIGICNGFQVLVNLGLLPALNKAYGKREVALDHNSLPRYNVRWVDLEMKNNSPWLRGIKNISLPIAHGEGKFTTSVKTLKKLKERKLICAQFVKGDIYQYQHLPANPNGAMENIAGITDETKRILGIMPHPERAIFFHQQPNFPYLKERYLRGSQSIPRFGPGLKIFQNSVNYFNSL
ncbi:phosphoribosylformylglycinamidine synthase [Candidatus Roizmanbacteria bacterium CG22_combo_CG10-13_8_21_14_all_35_9]|uniref:Phosphoribosylformylglycinamidine synthase n=4 Tax=Candidatus Roizmaniibacteriota TaxID=1752723 RepID=A0A2M8F4W2_9BACT|nr:MAG: phosphoribosylformylglycinamidine synthase [Candidatus Roizmanbacteria bacterium CG23_combo_of_CG06-09_8_20_14_all_35_49]PIP63167.1 MAG: phosphoribosylformylglycinamidine synthase [Candidatus Roizmanbacteria bacterium CG22_combo_CG10-13_8_21_14_all_35_9]PIY71159.1 MAG: phosphoribosylformylglycinamidine synthase [Candidatus Roizmanbacteria bacterium CG_4_10_14_0_8_um_filter_35_28]PJC34327.1 MAG: phosphoribosylformylglycinamidine synthase [Candidatus Roizmanbacteria bacterium CG_4_9_14_0_2